MRVLVAEDDPRTRAGLVEVLSQEGYQVLQAENGRVALRRFEQEQPHLVVLDIMMPEVNGYDVCRTIRKLDARIPVIFLSARSEEIDKVLGLELGADDFIVKPFGVKELVARIRAVTRRCLQQSTETRGRLPFRLGDLEVLPAELRARRGDQVIELSLRDVQILELFHLNPGTALSRRLIFDRCWGQNYIPGSRTLDQHISQLRKRIELDPADPRIIQTVRGVGYRYDAPA
jgi:DNA-binding response OmpR family regulator